MLWNFACCTFSSIILYIHLNQLFYVFHKVYVEHRNRICILCVGVLLLLLDFKHPRASYMIGKGSAVESNYISSYF